MGEKENDRLQLLTHIENNVGTTKLSCNYKATTLRLVDTSKEPKTNYYVLMRFPIT
jgi:hypothetical protein